MDELTPASSPRDRNLAAAASLIGDPARAAMLVALADGGALPAGELARRAGVHPATASAHLRRLAEGGLVRAWALGRHRYYELSGPLVATILEALAQVAPPVPVRSLRQDREASALAEARTCYDHLAGRRGVELRDRLLAAGVIQAAGGPGDRDHALTDRGEPVMASLGIDVSRLRASRRVFARSCLDWTQRHPHLSGALPAAVTRCFIERGWLSRGPGRGLRVADGYDRYLDDWLPHDGP